MKKFKKYFFMFIFIFSFSFIFFYHYNISINIPIFTKVIFNNYKHKYYVTDILNITYKEKKKKKSYVKKEEKESRYLVYIYNTHDTEKYYDKTYNIDPTVSVNNYIVKDYLEEKGIHSLIKTESIKDMLNLYHYNYNGSYKCSRLLIENAYKNNPSLKYFIDIHRDSLGKNKTTVNINGEDYASILFLLGLENKNYNENLGFINKINDKLNEYYPGLSKGILKKGGRGVNGVYNQDFSKYVILIEIGGQENTLNEVMNTSIAFSRAFYEVIKDEEHI